MSHPNDKFPITNHTSDEYLQRLRKIPGLLEKADELTGMDWLDVPHRPDYKHFYITGHPHHPIPNNTVAIIFASAAMALMEEMGLKTWDHTIKSERLFYVGNKGEVIAKDPQIPEAWYLALESMATKESTNAN